ncbi:hypothetical protein H8E52_10765 [bacterium]|nr:hypothetical protein [bacterium]
MLELLPQTLPLIDAWPCLRANQSRKWNSFGYPSQEFLGNRITKSGKKFPILAENSNGVYAASRSVDFVGRRQKLEVVSQFIGAQKGFIIGSAEVTRSGPRRAVSDILDQKCVVKTLSATPHNY